MQNLLVSTKLANNIFISFFSFSFSLKIISRLKVIKDVTILNVGVSGAVLQTALALINNSFSGYIPPEPRKRFELDS